MCHATVPNIPWGLISLTHGLPYSQWWINDSWEESSLIPSISQSPFMRAQHRWWGSILRARAYLSLRDSCMSHSFLGDCCQSHCWFWSVEEGVMGVFTCIFIHSSCRYFTILTCHIWKVGLYWCMGLCCVQHYYHIYISFAMYAYISSNIIEFSVRHKAGFSTPQHLWYKCDNRDLIVFAYSWGIR